jgi:hypothetical protein
MNDISLTYDDGNKLVLVSGNHLEFETRHPVRLYAGRKIVTLNTFRWIRCAFCCNAVTSDG